LENDDDVCWDFPIIAKKKETENNSEKDEELEGE